ncbi:MAG: DNA adenine methylase, partial [Proteobacteria bacterium]|nr:DNA adenine methylase [Pseudomonadota bacterium]
MSYPGGKGKCYQRLINLMPPHETYIETHLGSGAVLRNKRPAKTTIGIDA